MDSRQIVLRENWKFYLEEQRDLYAEPQSALEQEYQHQKAWGAWYKGYDDSRWKDVTVPHDWSVEQPFSPQYSSGTGYVAGGIGWYRVHFRLPEEYRGKSLKVVFDGVYKNSQVWCNSYYLGRRPYGYSTFSYDITHAAVFGDTDNVICVKVTHTDIADSRWFTGSGITRKVVLVIEEPVHPAEYGVFFHTERVEADETNLTHGIGRAKVVIRHYTEASEGLLQSEKNFGSLGAESAGRNRDEAGKDFVMIRSVLVDEDGESVLTLEGRTAAGEDCTLNGILEQARLWSPEHPYLYTLRTWYALQGEELTFYLVDETPVGIRQTEFHPQKGFFLNGEEIKIKGVCVHHDGGALGAAMEPEVWQRRLGLLKECGCNAIRCSHNPHMPELYELCDRMGFLMMDEAFDEWENAKNKWSRGHNVYPPVHQGYFEEFPQWYEADLRAMVDRDRNHPSVILWSIGNEIDYPNDPYCHPSFECMTGNNDTDKPAAERLYDVNKPNAARLVTIADKLERIVREEDDTRPVTLASAFPELSAETGLFQGLDVVGYNYKEHLYEKDHGRFPDKPFLGSENGHSYDAWLAVRDRAYISGQFLWTGIDYLGETKKWPMRGSTAGIMNCAGEKKPEFYRRKSFWSLEPVLEIATRRMSDGKENFLPMESHWNYGENEEILVKVYSNFPTVRLLLNGQELGKLTAYNGDGEYCFKVRYSPGVLTAEGYGEQGNTSFGEPMAVCSLFTTGQAEKAVCRIWQQPDMLTGQSWEDASGEAGYLYQLEMELLDAQGNPVSWQEKMVSVDVDGAGELAGLENGNLADITPYSDNGRSTFQGRLLAFVRRKKPGRIRVKVSMDNCRESIELL